MSDFSKRFFRYNRPMLEPTPTSSEPLIPAHAGLALAAMILGAICIPLAAYLGVQCLAVSLPVFGLWFFLPVVVLAIVLGMLGARSAHGVAGAALGVAALLICLSFILIDRAYGPEMRAQSKAASPNPAAQKLDQLLKMTGNPTSKP